MSGTYFVRKHFSFDAAHLLENHDGKCKNLHGHTWHGWAQVKSEGLNYQNMVIDFSDLKKILSFTVQALDHNFINRVLNQPNPTSEFIARLFYEELSSRLVDYSGVHIDAVCIQETDGSEAIYR